MLDVKMVRSNPDEVRAALLRRGAASTSSLDEFLTLEEERRRLLTDVESMRAARKRASDGIATVKKAGGAPLRGRGTRRASTWGRRAA